MCQLKEPYTHLLLEPGSSRQNSKVHARRTQFRGACSCSAAITPQELSSPWYEHVTTPFPSPSSSHHTKLHQITLHHLYTAACVSSLHHPRLALVLQTIPRYVHATYYPLDCQLVNSPCVNVYHPPPPLILLATCSCLTASPHIIP